MRRDIFQAIADPTRRAIILLIASRAMTPNAIAENFNQHMRRDIFQAIADPTRRAIILLIASRAMTPNAIAENFNSTRQAVSKHLRILTECDLVKQKQSGREIYYQLNEIKMKEIDKWLAQFRKIWESRFDELDHVLSTLKNRRSRT